MQFYPVNINIKNRKCLVVGGGAVGARKALTLIKAEACITIVSPKFTSDFTSIEKLGAKLLQKKYDANDIKGIFLVIAATDDSDLNLEISRQAKKENILCNIADLPDESDFILPSIIDRNDLMITISTSGKSPALAKKIKQNLENEFGSEYSDFLIIMGKIRKKLLGENHSPDKHRIIFHKLVNSQLLDAIKNKDYIQVDDILKKILGRDFTYDNLFAGDA
jgi:precorrin-2 dehydrogenase/sirohydrochlorin ferrochelatase